MSSVIKNQKNLFKKLLDDEYVKELKLSKEEMKECVKRAEKDVKTLPPWKDPTTKKRNKK